MKPFSPLSQLIDVGDSVVVVIDMQDWFLNSYAPSTAARLVAHVEWLCRLAQHFKVPLIALSEDAAIKGGINNTVKAALPPNSVIYDKFFFSVCRQPVAYNKILETRRSTVILVGIVTDVCVAQSALELIQEGLHVVVLADATFAPGFHHELGLQRIRDAGGLVTSVTGLYYEWARGVDACKLTRAQTDLLKRVPDDLIL